MKINKESLKWPQIDMGMRYLLENRFTYKSNPKKIIPKYVSSNLGIIEFGVGSGQSTKKIIQYLKQNNMDHTWILGYDGWAGLPKEQEGVDLFPKYSEGAYKFDMPSEHEMNYSNILLRKCTFDQIPDEDADMIVTAALIHIDCDLYISAYQALDWCFRNNLVVEHTLIAFDEYQTVGNKGGEYLAFKEICEKYNPEWREIFHYIYQDKDTKTDIRQNVIEITSINDDKS